MHSVRVDICLDSENLILLKIYLSPFSTRPFNYWGYDVATYDSDAVILKNPETFYRNHPNTHLISSASIWPENLGETWGFTLCTGAMLLRASPAMGEVLIVCV